jgi:hypothetical protein
MASKSNHWADVARWVEKVIDSCINQNQLDIAKNLFNNYVKTLGVLKNDKTKFILTKQLQTKIFAKQKELGV